MTRSTFTMAAIVSLYSTAAAAPPVTHRRRLSSRVSIWFATSATLLGLTNGILADHPGEFRSPCQYRGDGGQYRWAVKIDSERPPWTVAAVHRLTPSQLFGWTGGRGTILSGTPRQGRENEWIQLIFQSLRNAAN
jgi:hypothetical protein